MLHSDQTAWQAPRGAENGHESGGSSEAIRALARDIEAMQRQQGDSMAHIVGRLRALGDQPAPRARTEGGDEPWDAKSAEALMQTYETHALSQTAAPSHQKTSFEASQDWLGHRFSDVTERIKRTLGDLKPGSTVALLEERLDQFQRHIALALEDVVRRSDIRGIRVIEDHVADLGDKLAHLERQVSRLDGIEADVRSVIDQVSDERISVLLDSGSKFASGLEAMAVRAAEEVHARLGHANDADMRRHEDLRSLIEDSIRERRAADAQSASLVSGLSGRVSAQDDRYDEIKSLIIQTSQDQRQSEQTTISMLDTLQHALVQVLDRIDVLEEQHKRPAPVPAAPALAAFAHAVPDFRDAASHAPAFGRAEAQRSAAPVQAEEVQHDAPQAQAAPDAEDDGPQFDRMRRDFIADARRAKLKAAANRAEAVATGDKDSAPPRRSATAAVAASLTQAARAPAGGNVRLFGASPKLLAAALAVVVAINGGLLLINRKGPPAAPAVTVQPSLAPQGEAGGNNAGPAAAGAASPAPAEAPIGPRSDLGQTGADFVDAPVESTAPPPYGLQDDVLDPAPVESLGDGRAASVPSGMTIARPPGSLPDHVVAGVYQEQVLASLSGKLGSIAAKKSTGELLPEASGRIDAAYPAITDMAAVSPTEERVSGLDLPPATVGPLSLRMAAANGDASAEFEVAARLAEGKGTEQNYAEAMRWYQRSAGKGFAQAQYRLGTFYERGFGVAQDAERAKVWYARAAEQGNVKSMHNLAVLAAGGESGNPNYAAAQKWFLKAAQFGLPDSQYNLGVLLENGLGATADTIQAYKWYALAAKSGDTDALERRDALKASFSADQLKTADRLIMEFKVSQPAPLANDARAAGEDWKKRANNDKAR